jgi:hypothetical protein
MLGDAGVGGIEIELHQVTRDSAGVVDRAVSDGRGEFRLRVPPADTTGFAVHFATASHLGIRYFGAPLHPGDAGENYTIAVFDTAHVADGGASLRVERRDVIMIPDAQGGWEVNELLRIVNASQQTLVAPDGRPTLEFSLPRQAIDFEAGDGGPAMDELVRMDDRLLLLAPIIPGPRELLFRYRIPAAAPAELAVAVGTATDLFNLLVQQPSPAITVSGLGAAEPFEASGRSFAAYQGEGLEAGASVTVTWRQAGPPFDPQWAALATLGLVLLAGLAFALRRREGAGGGDGNHGGGVRVPAVVREPAPTEETVS